MAEGTARRCSTTSTNEGGQGESPCADRRMMSCKIHGENYDKRCIYNKHKVYTANNGFGGCCSSSLYRCCTVHEPYSATNSQSSEERMDTNIDNTIVEDTTKNANDSRSYIFDDIEVECIYGTLPIAKIFAEVCKKS